MILHLSHAILHSSHASHAILHLSQALHVILHLSHASHAINCSRQDLKCQIWKKSVLFFVLSIFLSSYFSRRCKGRFHSLAGVRLAEREPPEPGLDIVPDAQSQVPAGAPPRDQAHRTSWWEGRRRWLPGWQRRAEMAAARMARRGVESLLPLVTS